MFEREPSHHSEGGVLLTTSPEKIRELIYSERDVKGEIEKIFREERQKLIATALRIIKNREKAEDIVSKAFEKALRRFETHEKSKSTQAWLRTIVRNTALDKLKDSADRPHRNVALYIEDNKGRKSEAHTEDTQHRSVDDLVSDSRRDALVREAVDGLPTGHRDVATKFYFEGKKAREIAEELKIPLGTVLSRLHYIRDKLEASLSSLRDEVAVVGNKKKAA